jgi:hypothetical protein
MQIVKGPARGPLVGNRIIMGEVCDAKLLSVKATISGEAAHQR